MNHIVSFHRPSRDPENLFPAPDLPMGSIRLTPNASLTTSFLRRPIFASRSNHERQHSI